MDKKYSIIYADPPWSYKVWNKKDSGRTASSHYKTPNIKEISALDVDNISKENSVLLMWATYPNLKEAFELGESWGFTYKTVAFTWVKMNKKDSTKPFMGLGHYTRANAEIVLLFTKGKPLKRISKSVRQIVMAPIGKHSQKPEEVRNRIVQLFGDVPRVELFARSREGMYPDEEYKGWDVFGNEVNNSITIGIKSK